MIRAAQVLLLSCLAIGAEPSPGDDENARQLIYLGETRPVFIQLRVTSGGKPFEASWIDSIRTLHASLDKNGDGTLTVKEADPAILAAIVRLANGGAPELPTFADVDSQPKDGNVSLEELADAFRTPLGPFALNVTRAAAGRTDLLFDQLDRDKDSALARPELSAISGSLRPLDFNDDAMIGADEVELYARAAFTAPSGEASESAKLATASATVIELLRGDSTLRPARLLLKHYDKGRDGAPGRPDGKLSPSEIAVAADVFAAADTSGDDALNVDELRKWLTRPPFDLSLDVAFGAGDSGAKAKIDATPGSALSSGTRLRQLDNGEIEIAVGQVRIDIRLEDRSPTAEQERSAVDRLFKAADVNKNGYLEGKELATIDAPPSPLAGLAGVIDRDADAKIYLKELVSFIDLQAKAALARLEVNCADQGRAIFGILDLNRDRRLGPREVMRTVERVMSWDSDGDGRVSADEIPHHFQVSIMRGELKGLGAQGPANRVVRMDAPARAGDRSGAPEWFQKMDRNGDGDISWREFLGPRDQFDRLDRDGDGLIDPAEAVAAKPAGAGSDRP